MTTEPTTTDPMTGDELLIADYLDRVAARLRGPRRARADLLAELRSSLDDALDAHRSPSVSPTDAARRAVAELGTPSEVAAGFEPELTARQARRLGLALVPAGAAVTALWAYAAKTSDFGAHAGSWTVLGRPPMPLALAALGIAIVSAVLTVATTGRLTRWLRPPSRFAPVVAAAGGLSGAAIDVAILTLLVGQLFVAGHPLDPAPVLAAAGASATRFAFGRRAAHRCLGHPHSSHLSRLLLPG